MKNNKKTKKVKGMTLVEIIISLLIFSLCAVLMVHIAETSTLLTRSSVHTTRKVSAEEPLVNSRSTYTGTGSNVSLNSDQYRVSVTVNGATTNIKCRSYSTAGADPDAGAARTYGTNANLRYLIVPNTHDITNNTLPTEATT